MSNEDRRLGDQLSHALGVIVERFVETYCGSHDPEKMKWRWRFANSLGGSSVLYVLATPWSQIESHLRLAQGIPNAELTLNFNVAQAAMIFSVPIILSLVMASGIRNGGPMRFFFSGFFITAMMLGVVSYMFEPKAVVSQGIVSVPGVHGGYAPVPGVGYAPVPGVGTPVVPQSPNP